MMTAKLLKAWTHRE